MLFSPALSNGLSLESEWQQVFLSLQDSSQYHADLNNVVVWMVTICHGIFKSSSLFTKL